MNSAESLLSYLDAPIVVGDPDGRAVYVNPAFEERFPRAGKSALGLPLAELFDGGAREAVLRGVVTACEQRETARFRLRAGDIGYSAVASPIRSAEQAVGVVILFKEELGEAERLLQIQREMQGSLDELTGTLDTLLEQTGGRRNPHHRSLLEDGMRSITRLRKWSEEMQAAIAGRPATGSSERVAPVALLARPAMPRRPRAAFVERDNASHTSNSFRRVYSVLSRRTVFYNPPADRTTAIGFHATHRFP